MSSKKSGPLNLTDWIARQLQRNLQAIIPANVNLDPAVVAGARAIVARLKTQTVGEALSDVEKAARHVFEEVKKLR